MFSSNIFVGDAIGQALLSAPQDSIRDVGLLTSKLNFEGFQSFKEIPWSPIPDKLEFKDCVIPNELQLFLCFVVSGKL